METAQQAKETSEHEDIDLVQTGATPLHGLGVLAKKSSVEREEENIEDLVSKVDPFNTAPKSILQLRGEYLFFNFPFIELN